MLVIGSAGGGHRHPAWFHNLVAHPRMRVDGGVFVYDADAAVLTGTERDRAFDRAVEADPGWGDYQAGTDRVLPVVALDAVPGQPNLPRSSSPGQALRMVHDLFRRELALIRDEVARSGPGLGAQLRVNCLTLCAGVHNHHHGEDAMLFPHLARTHPDLAPVFDRLAAEHVRVAELTGELQALLAVPDVAPERLGAEVARLTGELERHLDREERELVPVLDGVPAG